MVEGQHPITESRNIYASSQDQRELVWSKTAGAEGLSPALPKVFILPHPSPVKGYPWGTVVCWAHTGVQLPVVFHPKEIKTACSEMDLWRKPQQKKGVKLRDLFPYALLIQAAVLMEAYLWCPCSYFCWEWDEISCTQYIKIGIRVWCLVSQRGNIFLKRKQTRLSHHLWEQQD